MEFHYFLPETVIVLTLLYDRTGRSARLLLCWIWFGCAYAVLWRRLWEKQARVFPARHAVISRTLVGGNNRARPPSCALFTPTCNHPGMSFFLRCRSLWAGERAHAFNRLVWNLVASSSIWLSQMWMRDYLTYQPWFQFIKYRWITWLTYRIHTSTQIFGLERYFRRVGPHGNALFDPAVGWQPVNLPAADGSQF